MKRLPLLIAVALTVAYAAYFSWFTVMRHHKLNSSRFDLGNVEQTIWNTRQGNFLEMTNPYGTEKAKRLAFHADFFLLALVPFYAALPTTETLLILQTLAMASGGLAVWLIARRKLGSEWLATLFVGVYVLQPALAWTNIFDIHAVAFAIPLILWAAWAALNKRYGLTLMLVVLAMTTKEQIGLMVAALGIFVWWRHRQFRLGLWLIGLPMLWSGIVSLITIPTWQSFLVSPPPVFESYFGRTSPEILSHLLTRPWQIISIFFNPVSLEYIWQLITPLGGLPLGSLWTLAATPDVFINLISTKPAQHLIYSHYMAGQIPWLMLGAIWSAGWLLRRWIKIPWFRPALVGWVAISVLVSAWAYGPLPGARHDHTRFATWRNSYAQSVRTWAARIPSSATVSVTNNIGSQFSRRTYLYSFPIGIERAEYVIVLEGHATPVIASQAEVSATISQLRQDPVWETLEHRGDLTVLRRR